MKDRNAPDRLLVVDDDAALRETIRDFFELEGYEVVEAGDVAQARDQLARSAPDLVLLDLNMPGGSGLGIVAEQRAVGAVPIIILSGKADMVDRVVGLEIGADDYMAKPFELRELLARVRSVLRRTKAAPQPVQADETAAADRGAAERVARFGDGLLFDPARRRVEAPNGEAIGLTGAEYNLVAAFIERPNRVLTRDHIAELTRRAEWDGFDRSIDTLVSRLRRKFAPYADSTRLFQTVRGEGYVLASEVSWSGGASAPRV